MQPESNHTPTLSVVRAYDFMRNDCTMDILCSACGHTQVDKAAYNDDYYRYKVVPGRKCEKCGSKPAPLADAALAGLETISGKLEIEENLDNTSDLVLSTVEDQVFWVAGRVPTEYARSMADAWNALPGLLARLRAAEATAKASAVVLEGYEKWEASVLEEDAAWANRAGQPWGTPALYDEWMELQAQRNAVLHPTVKKGQPNA